MDVTPLVVAPCSLIGLIVVVIAIRPSASSAIVEVLVALSGLMSKLMPWSNTKSQHETLPPTTS